ncbi:MAG: hypothetical protein RRA92_04240 [Gemmatimonadota bacterium]|nr:hypothetical protein [Gemmatimonadota bacterium]
MRISSRPSPGASPVDAGPRRALRPGLHPGRFSLLAALLAGALPGPLGAQSGETLDQGRFEIRIDGAVRGQESFAIRRQGAGIMAVGRLSREGAGAWIGSAEVGLRTDGPGGPLRYEYRSLQRPVTRIIATRTGRRIRITTNDPEGERMTELAPDPGLVLLQPGVAHQYWFLVYRLRSSSGDALSTLDPRAARTGPVQLLDRQDVALEGPDGEVRQAVLSEVRVDGTLHRVWTDAATDILLRVEIPERRWTAVRLPDRSEAESLSPEEAP